MNREKDIKKIEGKKCCAACSGGEVLCDYNRGKKSTFPNIPLWIDVNKELPKQHGNYLVMADEMDVMTFYPDTPDLWSSWQARGHKSGGDVTHWMELPDKPKKYEENF